MASSGNLLTNGWYSSSKGDYVYLEFAWSVTSTSIETNQKTIYWELRGKRSASGYVNAGGFYVVIDGSTEYSKSTDYRIELRNGTVVASGYKTFTHNPDGTRSFKVSIGGAVYQYSPTNCTASNENSPFILDTIPRQATLTSAPDFTDLDNPTITYSNPAGNAVSALDACISFTGAKDDIAYRAISKTGSSYPFPLTEAERDVLRNNTEGTNRSVIFFVRTKIGSVTYYSTITKKFTVTENDKTKPSVRMSATLNNGLLPGAFAGKYVQGKSRVDVNLSATGKYNADIKSYSATIDGKTYNSDSFTSDVIQKSGKLVGYAKDSRGFTGSTEQTINVIEYGKPLVIPLSSENAIQCYRSDGNGKRVGNSTSLWVKAKKSYYGVEGLNTCALQYRWKKASEVWNDSEHKWSDLIPSTSTTNEFNALIQGVVLDLKEAYTIQIQAIDTIGEYDIKTFEVPTQDVALHLGKGGKNVAIGTYCDYSEERTFYSDWKAIFDKEVVIGGAPVVNHIVEEGTDGIWTYRKWLDGTAECWGIYTQENVQVDKGWGVLFESKDFSVALPNGLFTETPQFSITLTGSGGSMVETSSTGSTTQTPIIYAVRPNAATIAILHTSIVAYGRWK